LNHIYQRKFDELSKKDQAKYEMEKDNPSWDPTDETHNGFNREPLYRLRIPIP
jgi:hypothetical protein